MQRWQLHLYTQLWRLVIIVIAVRATAAMERGCTGCCVIMTMVGLLIRVNVRFARKLVLPCPRHRFWTFFYPYL